MFTKYSIVQLQLHGTWLVITLIGLFIYIIQKAACCAPLHIISIEKILLMWLFHLEQNRRKHSRALQKHHSCFNQIWSPRCPYSHGMHPLHVSLPCTIHCCKGWQLCSCCGNTSHCMWCSQLTTSSISIYNALWHCSCNSYMQTCMMYDHKMHPITMNCNWAEEVRQGQKVINEMNTCLYKPNGEAFSLLYPGAFIIVIIHQTIC